MAEIDKLIQKFIRESKGHRNTKAIWKKSKVGELTLPNFKAYYRGTLIKIVWHCHKDGHIDKWNRIENLEINPLIN